MQVKKKRNLIFANVFLLLLLAAGATYAWFAINTSANVTLSEVEVKGPGDLEMRLTGQDDNSWKTYLTLSESNFQNLKMVDVSGAGDGTFYRPKTVGDGTTENSKDWIDVSADKNENGTPTTNHDGANVDYMQINVDFRARSNDSPSKINLKLKAGSKISPVAPSTKLDGPDAENKSTFGDFSKDYVVGGIRVSAMDLTGETPVRKFTWIPEPNVELEISATGENKTYSIVKPTGAALIAQQTHTYVPGIHEETVEQEKTMKADRPVDLEGVISGQITSGESGTETTIVTLTDTNSDGYYTGSATFYVWLEGCDTEARRALVGGKFRLQLLIDTEEVK